MHSGYDQWDSWHFYLGRGTSTVWQEATSGLLTECRSEFIFSFPKSPSTCPCRFQFTFLLSRSCEPVPPTPLQLIQVPDLQTLPLFNYYYHANVDIPQDWSRPHYVEFTILFFGHIKWLCSIPPQRNLSYGLPLRSRKVSHEERNLLLRPRPVQAKCEIAKWARATQDDQFTLPISGVGFLSL
jgi:hypothetical protein